MLPALFAVTLFVGAALLFLVQPLVGKLLLPLVGGTPGVWNTCMVFFQAVLLAGYLYAHRSITRLGVRRQAVCHLFLLAAVLIGFKIALGTTGSPVPVVPSMLPDDDDSSPLMFAQLCAMVFVAVGAPFFLLSTTSPVLQRWFATTGHPSARDPYFLYAASNAGSLVGLLAYPLVIERCLTTPHQKWVFAGGVFIYAGLVIACAMAMLRSAERTGRNGEPQAEPISPKPEVDDAPTLSATHPDSAALPLRRVARWAALAALPSSLLLGVTTHVSTDLAPVPLLWVVPLALYLLSFILVFARWPDHVHRAVGRITPMLILFVVLTLLTYAAKPLAVVGLLHMAAFFGVCLVCHGELAKDRPPPEQLTAFYFWMSLGGVFGGLINALVAPVVFEKVGMVEYPLALVLAAAVRPRGSASSTPFGATDVLAVVGLLGVSLTLVLVVPHYIAMPTDADAAATLVTRLLRGGLMFGIPAAVAFALVRKPLRYALALAALFVAGAFSGHFGDTLYMERNFFGVIRVTREGGFIKLFHGTTLHGEQRIDAKGRPQPLTYYHRMGPVGAVFAALPADRAKRVGVVGLGTGAVAFYAKPGQKWTFYEIDPAVIRVAEDERYFRFLSTCEGKWDVVLGDARRQLMKAPDSTFDVLILDGFCSDAIPVHLLTREAIALYVRKLAPGGIVLLHVSNHHLDLPPLVARLADDHTPPLAVRVCFDGEDRNAGKAQSEWMLLARSEADLEAVLTYRPPPRWVPLSLPLLLPVLPVPQAQSRRMMIQWDRVPHNPSAPLWRDDFANLLAAWKKRDE